MLISVGERISNALCAMAVHDLGHEAISLTGSQAGIVTDTVHGKAKIAEIRATRINDALDAGKIVLVAGFQGVSADSHDVTTLGRGGSNLDGRRARGGARSRRVRDLHRRRGRLHRRPAPRPRTRASSGRSRYEEMLELAASGAKVLQLRSVEFARNHDVRLHVRSTFSDAARARGSSTRRIRCSRRRSSPVSPTRDASPLYRVRRRSASRALFDAPCGRRRQRRHDPPGLAEATTSSSALPSRGPRGVRDELLAELGVELVDARRARQGRARRRRHEEPSRHRGEDSSRRSPRSASSPRSSRRRRSRSPATSAPADVPKVGCPRSTTPSSWERADAVTRASASSARPAPSAP